MAKVGIHINNKLFTIACDDGQEARVKQLGQYIDERFRELGQAGAAPNESYMLVLTSLVIADDMFEARDQAQKANLAAANAVQGVPPEQVEAEKSALRAEYGAHIQNLEAQLSATRTQFEQMQAQAKAWEVELEAARSQAANAPVADLDQARAEWLEEARAKEQDIAKVVDALSRQLETVVKGLKRA